MAEIIIRGQTITLDKFRGLEGDALDAKILEIDGVGPKTLPSAREKVLSALADEASKTAGAQCRNFEKCGNQAEGDYPYCTDCNLKWRTKEAKREDGETRPLRASVQKQLESARGFYVRYYKKEDPKEWSKEEVREAFLAAVAAMEEGDRFAREAMDQENPNPGLFKVARAHYFIVRNHLSTAGYHSARISIKGVLKGIPNYARKEVKAAVREAEESFTAAEGLDGRKLTRQLANAVRLMRDALSAARKERDKLNQAKPDDFYSGGTTQAIGDLIPDEQVEELQAIGDLIPDEQLEKADRRKRFDRKKKDRAQDS